MSYRTDQWFDLFNRGDETGESDQVLGGNPAGYYLEGDRTNRPFIYPDRLVRNLAGSDNRPDGSFVGTLKRGYIRNLPLGSEDDLLGDNPLRCQFQFNPATIIQSVSQAAGVLNFLQMEPAQFAQSLPGSNTFAFEVLFDRSMELNNYEPPSEVDLTKDDLWAQLSPETGGVLHDLSRLYSVIGVGLSEDLVAYATQVYARQAEAEASTMVQSGQDTSALPTLEENLTRLGGSGEEEGATNLNIGNSAILMPLPVRVVFSSLYVIEGLVGGIQVRFSKFNHAMIPMQCGVSITMQAMYVGFARKKTFFTKALEALANYERQEAPTATTDTSSSDGNGVTNDVPDEVKNELGLVEFSLYPSGGTQDKEVDSTAITLDEIVSHAYKNADGNLIIPYKSTTNSSTDEVWESNTSAKIHWPRITDAEDSATFAAIEKEELKVTIDKAFIQIYRFIPEASDDYNKTDLQELYENLKNDAVTDKSSGAEVREVRASVDETEGEFSCKIPNVMLVREVLLDPENIDTGNNIVDNAPDAKEFFDTTSNVYSTPQKGNDDRLVVQGYDGTKDGLLILDTASNYLSSSAFGISTSYNHVRFLVHFEVSMILTDKNGVAESRIGKNNYFIDSVADFTSTEITAPITMGWGTRTEYTPTGDGRPPEQSAEEIADDAENAYENNTIGYGPS